jgi:mono/diheme cytochrome c family protein
MFVGIGMITLLLIWLLPSFPPPSVPPSSSLPPLPLPVVPLPPGDDAESVAWRQSIRNGERIYQRLCYHCHGHQGKGDRNAYMESIGHKPADHTDLKAMQRLSDAEFFRILHDGVTDQRGWLTMPPWSSVLSDAEMWDVIRYVRRLPLPAETLP